MPPQEPNRDTQSAFVFTIGHSNHSADHFSELLKMHRVDVVVDVRSQPYSRYANQFDQSSLKLVLRTAGTQHLYLGKELGGRPEGNDFYDQDGRVLYDRVAATTTFRKGIARLEKGIAEFRVAVLCAEENPAACHRRLLVGRVLIGHGIHVKHIRGDGSLQTEEDVAADCKRDRDQFTLFHHEVPEPWKSHACVTKDNLNR